MKEIIKFQVLYKKQQILIILIIIYCACSVVSCNNSESKFEKNKLAHLYESLGVKTQTVYKYFYSSGEVSSEGVKIEELHYDRNGNLISKTEFLYVSNQSLTNRHEYDYDVNNRVIKDTYITNNNKQHTIIYSYNDNLTTESHYDAEGNLAWKGFRTYNKNRKLLTNFHVGLKSDTAFKNYFYYNPSTNLLDSLINIRNNDTSSIEIYKYDSEGNLIEIFDKKYSQRSIYSYNNATNWTKWSNLNSDGDSLQVTERIYGINSRLLEETRLNKGFELLGGGKIPTSIYKDAFQYDKNGLLISKISYENISSFLEPKEMLIYEYTYY